MPFKKVLVDSRLSGEKSYLSCGRFVIRSKQALQEWAKLTVALPPHFLFEQNAFNIVVYKHIQQITLLDWATFGVCGSELNNLTVVSEGGGYDSIRLGDKPIIMVHVAATNEQAALSCEGIALPVENGFLCGLFRSPINPELNRFVMELVVGYAITHTTNNKLLRTSGALCTENPLIHYGKDHLKDREYAHYFTYGNAATPK